MLNFESVNDEKSLLNVAVFVLGDHEGFRSKRYKDTKGIWTIGYGFNLESGTFKPEQVEKWTKKGITREEANEVLLVYVKQLYAKLVRYSWFNLLAWGRKLAIIDMSYNMGIGWIDRWVNTIGHIKAKRYKAAANAIKASLYTKQVGVRGLRNAVAIALGRYPRYGYTFKELMLVKY